MSQIDLCLPSSLLPSTKNPFIDLSDTDSIPSQTHLSRATSLSETNTLNLIHFLHSSKAQSGEQYTETCLPEIAGLQQCEEDLFPGELYERIDEFLDQEGFFITVPEPFANIEIKTPTVVLLSASFKLDIDSPLSDSHCPSFLARRNNSLTLKSSFSTLATAQMRKFSLGAENDTVAATPCYLNLTKKSRFGKNQESREEDSEPEDDCEFSLGTQTVIETAI